MTIEMKRFLEDILHRAVKTFGQTFLAALGVIFGSAALDASQIVDVAGLKKFLLSLAAAVLAAFISAIQNTLKGLGEAKYQDKVDAVALEPEDELALKTLNDNPDADLDGFPEPAEKTVPHPPGV